MANILLLGGTGSIGTHVVDLLQKKGFNCFVTTRHIRPQYDKVRYIRGNAHDVQFLDYLLKLTKWEYIIDFMHYSTHEFNLRVEKFLKSCKQYIFLSSARVYAPSEKPITEEAPRLLDIVKDTDYLSTDEYALSKARQENILKATDGNYTIIRPYITFGENRFQLGVQEKERWLYRALKRRTIIFSMDIASKTTTLTYGHNVAQGIVALLGNASALGQAFHITSSEFFKWEDILSTYCSVIERECNFTPKVIITDHWEDFHGGTKEQVTYDRLYNRVFDNGKISNYINTDSFEPTLSSLDNCLSNFIKSPHFLSINWKSEAIKDRRAKELTSLFEIHPFKQKYNYLSHRFKLFSK